MNYWLLMQIWHKASLVTKQGLIVTLCGKFAPGDSTLRDDLTGEDKMCKVCYNSFLRWNRNANWFLKQSNR